MVEKMAGHYPDPEQVSGWLFDLDNTLYSADCKLFLQMNVRMTKFVCRVLGLSEAEAAEVKRRYFREYGTTLRGLMDRHGVDPDDYLAYVHDIDLSVVPENPRLDQVLDRLPGRKLVFTNGARDHAGRVMAKLGIARHFSGVFDIADAGYVPKPAPETYAAVVSRFDLDPAGTVMLDDMAKNLPPAARLGMKTVWIRTGNEWAGPSPDGDEMQDVHFQTEDLTGWLESAAGKG